MSSQNNSNSPMPVTQPQHPQPNDGDEVDLAQVWAVLKGGRWTIAICVLVALILGYLYVALATPDYKADALLQLEMDHSTAPLQGLNGQAGGGSAQALAEMEIMKSRSVLGRTVDDLGLDISAKPKYFPYIGESLARRASAGTDPGPVASADSGSWLPHYAWHPTTITIPRLELSGSLSGKSLTLRALGGGEYVLFGPDGQKLLQGKTGKLAEKKLADGGKVRIFVRELKVSAPPTDFKVQRKEKLSAIGSLSGSLEIEEKGEKTGIMSMALEGSHKEHIRDIVNSVADNYLRENVKTQSQQAKKSLEFLDEQLPDLREELQDAENRLAQFQKEHDQPVDLSQSGQALLSRDSALQSQQEQLQLKLVEMRHQFGDKHPRIKALKQQLAESRAHQKALKKRLDQLPDLEKQALKLQRDVKVKTELYTALLNRAQELRIMKAGTVGNVHIVDHAQTPISSVWPKKKLILGGMLLLGLLLGTGIVFLRMATRRAVNDPSEIERQLGLPLYAVVPHSRWLEMQGRRAEKAGRRAPLLARDRSDDIAVEAVRSLRTSLYFAQIEQHSNTIIITGPAPGVGKSFISINLAWLLAETGQKVILVDSDMRKGRLHEYFDSRNRESGLSQVLTGQVDLQQVLRPLDNSNVSVLTSGQIPPNPSELLMRRAFPDLLNQLKEQFDLVILDAPPVLAVTDASIMAGLESDAITFLVTQAGAHTMAEIEESIKRLTRQGKDVSGVIFNGYKPSHANAAGYGGYYQYEYKSGK